MRRRFGLIKSTKDSETDLPRLASIEILEGFPTLSIKLSLLSDLFSLCVANKLDPHTSFQIL
jgi:hypothetical protein